MPLILLLACLPRPGSMGADDESRDEGVGWRPSLAYMSAAAGFVRVPRVGDVFITLSRHPHGAVAREYTDRSPNGQYRGTYRAGTAFYAIGVDVVWLPPSSTWRRSYPGEFGIAVEVDSLFEEGATSWVNITRGSAVFVNSMLHESKGVGKGKDKDKGNTGDGVATLMALSSPRTWYATARGPYDTRPRGPYDQAWH